MKFKPTQKKAIKTGVLLVTGLIGVMASDGVMGAVVPQEYNTPLVKGAAALASGFGASAIEGEDNYSTATKGLLLGSALSQGIKAVREVVAEKVVTTENPTGYQNFVNKAMGMNSSYIPMGLKSGLPAEAWERNSGKPVIPISRNKVSSRAI